MLTVPAGHHHLNRKNKQQNFPLAVISAEEGLLILMAICQMSTLKIFLILE